MQAFLRVVIIRAEPHANIPMLECDLESPNHGDRLGLRPPRMTIRLRILEDAFRADSTFFQLVNDDSHAGDRLLSIRGGEDGDGVGALGYCYLRQGSSEDAVVASHQ